MKIVKEYPPNYEELSVHFPFIKDRIGVLYCWDTQVFNPSGIIINDFLMAHEEVHSGQQKGEPEAWWRQYIDNPTFRYNQELSAHIREFEATKGVIKDRNARNTYKRSVAMRLAGPLYDHCTTFSEALRAISDN